MANLRLFIAIQIPGPIKIKMAEAQQKIARNNPHVKAVAAPGIHLTLKFLGDTPEGKIPELRRAMEIIAAQFREPINLRCVGAGAFPDMKKPRILWAGLEGDTEPLISLARRLDNQLATLGFEPENRPFLPHLTLARVREPKMLSTLRKHMEEIADMQFGEFQADALVLYRSQLMPTGAVYTSIERVKLGR